MITVNLYYTGRDGAAQRFAEEMESSGTADLIRAEEGNLRYQYFTPLDDPETVLLMIMSYPRAIAQSEYDIFKHYQTLS